MCAVCLVANALGGPWRMRLECVVYESPTVPYGVGMLTFAPPVVLVVRYGTLGMRAPLGTRHSGTFLHPTPHYAELLVEIGWLFFWPLVSLLSFWIPGW